MFRDMSPTFGSAFPAGNAPPTPPHNDPLDDIYGSAPSSPVFASHDPLGPDISREHADEILSDLPSRQRALDTDAYREGLSNSKGQFVQEGFDEGYSLGANFGMRIGYILGVLQGFVAALQGQDGARLQEARKLWEEAQKELAIEELLGPKWVGDDGIWKWDVHGREEEVTFREVAEQHPVVETWMDTVGRIARKWGVDLEAIGKSQEVEEDGQS